MIEILLAMASMAVRDCLGTMLTVAEARGRALTAASMDALGDFASVGVTLYGAGVVIQHGWTPHTGLVLGAMVVTSFVGTLFWMRLAQHWMPVESAKAELALLRHRIGVLEGRGCEDGYYKNSHRV